MRKSKWSVAVLVIALVIGVTSPAISVAETRTEGPNWLSFCLPYKTPTPWGSECGTVDATNGHIYTFNGMPAGWITNQGEMYFSGWGQQGSMTEVSMLISWQVAGFGTSEGTYAFVGSTLGEHVETILTLLRELTNYGIALHQGQYDERPLRNIAVSLVRNPANAAPLTRFVGINGRVFHESVDGRVLFEESGSLITIWAYRISQWKFIGNIYKADGAKG